MSIVTMKEGRVTHSLSQADTGKILDGCLGTEKMQKYLDLCSFLPGAASHRINVDVGVKFKIKISTVLHYT